MPRLITVQFAIPDDDPASGESFFVKELQEILYDFEGWAGSFKVIDNIEFDGDPASFGFEE